MLSVLTCMREEKWLPTDMGFWNPKNAVLFDSTWGSLSPIASLLFIDRTSQICVYKYELEELGVAVGIEQVQFNQKHWLRWFFTSSKYFPSVNSRKEAIHLLFLSLDGRSPICLWFPALKRLNLWGMHNLERWHEDIKHESNLLTFSQLEFLK